LRSKLCDQQKRNLSAAPIFTCQPILWAFGNQTIRISHASRRKKLIIPSCTNELVVAIGAGSFDTTRGDPAPRSGSTFSCRRRPCEPHRPCGRHRWPCVPRRLHPSVRRRSCSVPAWRLSSEGSHCFWSVHRYQGEMRSCFQLARDERRNCFWSVPHLPRERRSCFATAPQHSCARNRSCFWPARRD
jgi:hypothetical protein